MTCQLVGASGIVFLGLGARGLGGEPSTGPAPSTGDVGHTPVSPSAPPAVPAMAVGCSLPAPSPVAQAAAPGQRSQEDQSGRELGKSSSSKQDPYLGAACVGRRGAEGLVPAPRGTRVLPAERWGCPAAGQARATQLCPQPCVRLSRNGGSLHGGEGAGQPCTPEPRGCRGCLLGSVLQPEGNGALGELGCSSLTSNA